MAPSDLADRLAFLFPTTYCPGGTTTDAPDVGDHDTIRELVSLELRLPTAANEVEERALSTFVDLRAYFAHAVLRDAAGAWQAVLRLLDEGHDRDEVLEQINDVLGEHVLDPMTSGAEIDVEGVNAAFDRLGRWDPIDEEVEHLPWMIDEWRSSGSVADDEIARIVREVIHPEVLPLRSAGGVGRRRRRRAVQRCRHSRRHRRRPGVDMAQAVRALICMHSTGVRIDSATHERLERLAAELQTTVGHTVTLAVRAFRQGRIDGQLSEPLRNDETDWLDTTPS